MFDCLLAKNALCGVVCYLRCSGASNSLPLTPITAELFGDTNFLNSQYARLAALLDSYIPSSEPPSSAPTAHPTSHPAKSSPSASTATRAKHTQESAASTSECQVNKACMALGMKGQCCPTLDGTLLACCDAALAMAATSPATAAAAAAAAGLDPTATQAQGVERMTGEWESIMFALYASK